MKRLAALAGTTLIVLMVAACGQPDTRDADLKAIRSVEAQWNADYAAKDLDKIADHYANDAVLIVPGMASTSGKEAIRSSLQQMVSDSAMSLQFQASKVDVAKSGDLAYTQGSYTLTLTDPQTKSLIHDHGSYVTVYRKMADKTWKAVSDIASSEVPPPAPKSAKSAKSGKSTHKAASPAHHAPKKKHHK